MRLQRIFTPAAAVLAITMAAVPALAQNDGNDGQRRSRERSARSSDSGSQGRESQAGVAVPRSSTRGDVGRAAGADARSRPSGSEQYSAGPNDTRGSDSGRNASRSNNSGNGGNGGSYGNRSNNSGNGGSYSNRSYNGGNGGSYSNRSYNGGGNNGSYGNRGYDNGGHNNYGNNGRYDNHGYYGYRGPGYRGAYNRSQWHNRVHFGLGISIFSGSPFSFHFGYGWRPGFDYRYPMQQGRAYGGMSFLLNPDYAEVYIDGNYVGVARDFGGQPVPVAVGYHRIELYAQGFAPVAFDVNVYPGQVIPYRGNLVY